jgi:hypothetical protein
MEKWPNKENWLHLVTLNTITANAKSVAHKPGVNVMITNFGDFYRVWAIIIAVF